MPTLTVATLFKSAWTKLRRRGHTLVDDEDQSWCIRSVSTMDSVSTMATMDDNPGTGRTLDKFFYQKSGKKLELFIGRIFGNSFASTFEVGRIALEFISFYNNDGIRSPRLKKMLGKHGLILFRDHSPMATYIRCITHLSEREKEVLGRICDDVKCRNGKLSHRVYAIALVIMVLLDPKYGGASDHFIQRKLAELSSNVLPACQLGCKNDIQDIIALLPAYYGVRSNDYSLLRVGFYSLSNQLDFLTEAIEKIKDASRFYPSNPSRVKRLTMTSALSSVFTLLANPLCDEYYSDYYFDLYVYTLSLITITYFLPLLHQWGLRSDEARAVESVVICSLDKGMEKIINYDLSRFTFPNQFTEKSHIASTVFGLFSLSLLDPFVTLAPGGKARALHVFQIYIKSISFCMRDEVCQDKKDMFVRIMFLKAARRNIQLMTDVNKLENIINNLKRSVANYKYGRDETLWDETGVNDLLKFWGFFFSNPRPKRELRIGSTQGHNECGEPPFEYWRGLLDGRRDGCLEATFTDIWNEIYE